MTTALVVMDMLNDFVDGRLANPASKPVVDVVGGLVEDARGRDGWVVVYANDAHHPGDLEFAVFGEHAVVGTPGAAVLDTLTPEPADIVVDKRYYSAFTETDLASTCLVRGIDRLVLTGQHTDCCCRHTAYDAFRRGLSLAVVSDATCVFEPLYGADTSRRQDEALRYLRDFYRVEVLDSHSVR